MGAYQLIHADGHRTVLTINGRDEWALQQLLRTGSKGCTPKDNPAPRWSGYVFNLRRMGIDIETVHERHGGDVQSPRHAGRDQLRPQLLLLRFPLRPHSPPRPPPPAAMGNDIES